MYTHIGIHKNICVHWVYVCVHNSSVFLKDSGIAWELFLCFRNSVFPGSHLLRTHLCGHLSLDNWWTQSTWKLQTPHPAYIGPFSALLTRGPGFRSFRNTGLFLMSILWHLGPRARSDVRTIGSYCDKFTFLNEVKRAHMHSCRKKILNIFLAFLFLLAYYLSIIYAVTRSWILLNITVQK